MKRRDNVINFIICEDNQIFANNVKRIVTNYMMNFDIEYHCKEFSGYNDEFRKVAEADDIGFKIYLLDIKTDQGSGLDAARMIREEFDDWVSIIVIITSFNQYRYEALGNRLYLMDFISKLDNCEANIKKVLERSMKHYNKRYKSLNYEYNHTVKKIEFRHIIYIEKEQDSKRCIIKTTYGTYLIPKTLKDTLKLLDDRFVKMHKSMIVNKDYVVEYRNEENKIIFKNGEATTLVARGKKKELKESVGTIN